MKQLSDNNLMLSLVEKYGLKELFEKDMTPLMTLHALNKAETINEGSDVLDSMYFLVSGKIGIYKLLENGRSLLTRLYQPLSIIGDLEFLDKYPVKTHVEAQIDSLLIRIKFEDLYKNAYDDPRFLRFIIRNLSRKLYTFSNASSINLLYPLENRFASYLVSVYLHPDVKDEIKVERITEMAMLLGTSYRHLLRVIQKFVANGIISYHRGVIRILEHNKLKELAKENIYE